MSNLWLRRAVAFWFVAVFILAGLPAWYKLTTIYRAPLPSEYIRSIHQNMHSDVHIVIPVYVRSDTYRFPDVHDAIQVQVNELLRSRPSHVQWSLQVLEYDESVVDQDSDYVATLVLDDFAGFTLAYDSKETLVFFNNEAVMANDVPFFAAQTLVEHTFGAEWEEFSGSRPEKNTGSSEMAISYSPNVHLSISLLTGDGRPIGWDIDTTLDNYFTPLRRFLSPLVNFTVDTSIVQFNDLNVGSIHSGENTTWQDLAHTIDLSELSSMNYYKEKSVLNLAIVFPSLEAGELSFVNATSQRPWQTFMVPRWGSLVLNKAPLPDNVRLTEEYLAPVIYNFARELFQFLGLATQSADLTTPYATIDSFKRVTIIKNLEHGAETLWSLTKLTEQFPQMSVPKQVLSDVEKALDLRLQLIELLNNPEKGGDRTWNQALLLSNEFVRVCERAFFHKEMVQQNFFPQEHKIAVYLPLLGPLTVIILSGLLNALREKEGPHVANNSLTEKERLQDDDTTVDSSERSAE
ncbi:GPI-anchor transamidase GPI17 [Lachancea thermotolerans CBS 6340]|uniref:KLTH0G04180p n=1 Tax=Lachancea thermotolerans (strain ATCC 56472 / CBS 6340 / NRRL Y-8284) TaxID=559295 RepID=C5DLX0_LACTC|nr:KLTH0G04180p [Lachancea thermotolerans CBS 6340]CAR24781.1 KLTH0G04180p [Lachancea thermotolerans CBS 6340]